MREEEGVAQGPQDVVNTPMPDVGIPMPDAAHDEVVYGEDDFLSDAVYIAQVGGGAPSTSTSWCRPWMTCCTSEGLAFRTSSAAPT